MDYNNFFAISQVKEPQLQEKLNNFLKAYYDYADELTQPNSCYDNVVKCMVDDFFSWLDMEGTDLLKATIGRLDAKKERKIMGFIEYYTFLLSSAQADVFKMLDLLFAIPGQFAKEFMVVQSILKGSIDAVEQSDDVKSQGYVFNMQGTFDRVPCFCNIKLTGVY